MKKFLLVLSCFLATWCSVQAGLKCSTSGSELYGTSQSASMLMASAPAAAPVPAYPAVIEDLKYNSSNKTVTIKYTVNNAGVVSFDLETSDGVKVVDVYKKNQTRGAKSDTIQLKPEWLNGTHVAFIIKVDGKPCGGKAIEPNPVTDVKVGLISYNAVDKTVTINYSVVNPVSKKSRLKIKKNGKLVYNKAILFSDKRSFLLTPSEYEFEVGERIDYGIIISNGDATDGKNFKVTTNPNGYIESVNPGQKSAAIRYNLSNTYNPYVFILDKNGNEVGRVKIENTNTDYKTVTYEYSSAIKEKTAYTACLYDIDAKGQENPLGISKGFVTPEFYRDPIDNLQYFEWHYNDGNPAQLDIWCTSNVPSSVKKVSITVINCATGAYHEFKNVNRNEHLFVNIPQATSKSVYYVVRVEWTNGKSERKFPIRK